MKKLVIYGAAFFDLIKLVDAINREEPRWKIIGFLDDTPELQGKLFWNLPVLGGRELLAELAADLETAFVNNVTGHWKGTRAIARLLADHGCSTPNLVHPSVDVSYAELGIGCTLADGCVVGMNAKIGNFVTARYNCTLSHDVRVDDYSFFGPGATVSGFGVVEQGCFVGAGATLLGQKAVMREGSMAGAGALVAGEVPAHTIVTGVPARVISKRDGGPAEP